MELNGKIFNMYKGQEITYEKFWNLLKDNQGVKWYVMAYGGNYSFLQPSLTNYIKVAEILDIDEEGPDGKNEAGYKVIYFQQYEEHNNKFVEAGGFGLDDWKDCEYTIRVHNRYPLEILVDWYSKNDGFRDIILLRDQQDMLKM